MENLTKRRVNLLNEVREAVCVKNTVRTKKHLAKGAVDIMYIVYNTEPQITLRLG